jgi:RNA polymerase sigma-70 factor (ECF subfamily)
MTLTDHLKLLDQLVEDHLPEALRFAQRLTGSQESAAEVVQEALYRAARSMATFRGQSHFRTWFYRIVISAFHDLLAASAETLSLGDAAGDLADSRSEDPGAAAVTNELRTLIAERISALPPRQREVLVLVSYEQMRASEVAEVLGISESNVHANLHYARARLRQELSPYLSET